MWMKGETPLILEAMVVAMEAQVIQTPHLMTAAPVEGIPVVGIPVVGIQVVAIQVEVTILATAMYLFAHQLHQLDFSNPNQGALKAKLSALILVTQSS